MVSFHRLISGYQWGKKKGLMKRDRKTFRHYSDHLGKNPVFGEKSWFGKPNYPNQQSPVWSTQTKPN